MKINLDFCNIVTYFVVQENKQTTKQIIMKTLLNITLGLVTSTLIATSIIYGIIILANY